VPIKVILRRDWKRGVCMSSKVAREKGAERFSSELKILSSLFIANCDWYWMVGTWFTISNQIYRMHADKTDVVEKFHKVSWRLYRTKYVDHSVLYIKCVQESKICSACKWNWSWTKNLIVNFDEYDCLVVNYFQRSINSHFSVLVHPLEWGKKSQNIIRALQFNSESSKLILYNTWTSGPSSEI